MSIETLHSSLTNEIRGSTGRDRRKLANNTYGRIEPDGSVVIRLHNTDIARIGPTDASYDTGGWFTVTTKERINRWLPAGFTVSSRKGIWHVWAHRNWDAPLSRFYDGLVLVDTPEGVKVLNPALDDPDEPIRKAVNRYVALYTNERIAELVAHAVTSGTAGDCWFCSMFEQAGVSRADHLLDHLAEGYTMATLAKNAVDASGYRSDVYLGYFHPDRYTPGTAGFFGDVIRRAIRKYLKARVLNHGFVLPDAEEAA